MDWRSYVRNTVGNDRQVDIARRTDIDQTTISRWLTGVPRGLSPASVTKFARGYGAPVLEAFVAAGLLTDADIVERVPRLDDFTIAELLAEIARRTEQADAS